MKQAPAYWTDETTAMALKLSAANMSGAEIAARLPPNDGLRPSRSAVCSKLRRMGSPTSPTPWHDSAANQPRAIARRAKVGPARNARGEPMQAPTVHPGDTAEDAYTPGQPSCSKALARMERQLPPDTPAMAWGDFGDGCQWPMGKLGAEDRWCGARPLPREKGKRRPYCGEHWTAAHTKTPGVQPKQNQREGLDFSAVSSKTSR